MHNAPSNEMGRGTTLPSNVETYQSYPDQQAAGATFASPGGRPLFLADAQACSRCHRVWGRGRACQFCRQVDGLTSGVRVSSPARRLAAWLLDVLLVICTLVIGWLVWLLIVCGRGQTPAKQILGMRYVTVATGRRAGWGRTFGRELVKGICGGLGLGLLGALLLWDSDTQAPWDKVAGTLTVDDPLGLI